MHSIFQIRISQDTKCADKTGFSRPGHILLMEKEALIEEHNQKPLVHKNIDW